MMDFSNWTFLILAGGKSSRMLQSKAELTLGTETFQAILRKKAEKLGFGEVLISTAAGSSPNTVADRYPDRGPLGGLHAGFLAAKYPHVFVTAVDVPQLPPSVIERICQTHIRGDADASLLWSEGRIQPLIGAYHAALSIMIEKAIRDQGIPVRRFLDQIQTEIVCCPEDSKATHDCDTPQDYAALLAYWKKIR